MKITGKIMAVVLAAAVCMNGFAEDMDAKIKKAVEDLMVRLNAPMEVSIGTITLEETAALSAFSRYLHTKINFFAVSHDMCKVMENTSSTRSVSRVRLSGVQSGEITGTYIKSGGTVEVMLYLKPRSGGALIASSSFSVPLSELEKMELPILPANTVTETHARQSEEIFAALPEKNDFHVEVWMDSASGTYYEGDIMTVYFSADKNCYYKMYYIDTRGTMNLIYPTRQGAANFLRAHDVKEMKFECIPPYGSETFLFMASEEAFPVTASDFAETSANSAAIARAVRGLRYHDNGQSAAASSAVSAAASTATARFSYTLLPKK
ncbi:MAG: DUF4384 domain-containing protein [Treponema sp.]|jgi:hypothetical protein|nr:DUF4384 domain-containing protein [Treponema sp.]